MKILGNRVMIKPLSSTRTTESGMKINEDLDALPRAEIVLASENSEEFVREGDIVYYTKTRESGKCSYNGEERFIIPVSNIVAIL